MPNKYDLSDLGGSVQAHDLSDLGGSRSVDSNQQSSNQPGLLDRAGNYVDQNFNQPIQRQFVNPANNFAAGLEQGTLNVVPGLYDLGASGINALGGNLPKLKPLDFAPHGDLPAEAGTIASFFENPLKLVGKLGEIPEVYHAASNAMKIPLIAKGLDAAANIIGKAPKTSEIVGRIAGNSLLGGAYNPDHPVEGMALGAGVGGLSSALPYLSGLAGEGINALRPSNLLRGNLSPTELGNNVRVTQGTETGLGDVIGSPGLKRFRENILTKIPFSGASDSMQRTAGQIVDKGHDILNNLLGKNDPENFNKVLSDAVQNTFKDYKNDKINLYNKANDIADKSNLELPLDSFSDTAKKYSDAINSTNILKYEPDMAYLFSKLQNYKNPVKITNKTGSIVDQSGNPIINENIKNYPRLQEANLLKGKFNDLANQYETSIDPSDHHMASVFRNLSSSLKDDINSAIDKSGNKQLRGAYDSAESNYAKNYSTFLDKDIYKFANGQADPDTLLNSFIKTGKSSDRANLLEKLTSKLSPDNQKLLGYGYLQRALDQNNVINPLKVDTLLSKNALGSRQLKALFPNTDIRNSLMDYKDLVNKNVNSLSMMSNPKTGQMATDILPLLSKSPGSLINKILLARPASNYLASETSRMKLVNKMIENQSKTQ